MPIAKLAILFIGVKDRQAERGKGETTQCHVCKKVAPTKREKRWTDLRIFGLPVLTWKRRYTLVCSHCGKVIKENKSNIIQSMFWYFN